MKEADKNERILFMKNCFDLYFLSTIACKLPECLSKEELAVLAASLKALGEMLEVVLTSQEACKEKET